jgi:hypothetical protein
MQRRRQNGIVATWWGSVMYTASSWVGPPPITWNITVLSSCTLACTSSKDLSDCHLSVSWPNSSSQSPECWIEMSSNDISIRDRKNAITTQEEATKPQSVCMPTSLHLRPWFKLGLKRNLHLLRQSLFHLWSHCCPPSALATNLLHYHSTYKRRCNWLSHLTSVISKSFPLPNENYEAVKITYHID